MTEIVEKNSSPRGVVFIGATQAIDHGDRAGVLVSWSLPSRCCLVCCWVLETVSSAPDPTVCLHSHSSFQSPSALRVVSCRRKRLNLPTVRSTTRTGRRYWWVGSTTTRVVDCPVLDCRHPRWWPCDSKVQRPSHSIHRPERRAVAPPRPATRWTTMTTCRPTLPLIRL